MGEMKKHRPLSEISTEIEKATKAYEDAKQSTGMARSREASCLNHLNAVQKELDAAIEAMKESAPRDSKWKDKERFKATIPE